VNAPSLGAISISDFRSIRGTIAFSLDSPVVLLHGANGTGKTTVMSALELALTGGVAELPEIDRKHLVNRSAKAATVELATSTGAVSFHLTRSAIKGSPLLLPTDARFFTERCYLAQRTLGQLLEIYQSADGQKDSPLTRFVKEILRLDELDALLEGLDPVKDKRLVKRLVPQYGIAERDADSMRGQINRAGTDLKILSADADAIRAQIGVALAELEAPPTVEGELEPGGAAETWLAAVDEEEVLGALVATRRELSGLRSRWTELASTRAARDSAAAEAGERAARDAADAWWRSHGAALETVLDELRSDFAGMPSVVATTDPSSVHKIALGEVNTELARLNAAISADEVSLAEIERLDSAIANAQARIAAIDGQLASSETASVAEDLGRTLATLIPHLHGEDCPVCGRDFTEASDQPLSAHLAARVSELGERAERLQSLAAARLEGISDLRGSQDARNAVADRRMEPAAKVAAKAKVARLDNAQHRLAKLAAGVAEGAHVIRQAVEAERSRALAQEHDRASAELRIAVETLASSLALPPADSLTTLDDAIGRLSSHVISRITALEAREVLRRDTRKRLQELTEKVRLQRELQVSVKERKAALARTELALKDLDGRRKLMKVLRSEVEESRTRIVRRVFNRSLNQMWRDLFVRLAPDEPFVPAFHVPESIGEGVAANLETVHRDGKPGGSPGTMLSAGNLNTAALTLFLALHLSAEPHLPWLMLDDPVQSMDEVHVSQLAALLRTVSKKHGRRVIIAVHERPLFEYLALELSPAQPGDSLATVELSRSRTGKSIARPEFFAYEEDTALVSV
jgi:exonuclease SbcC